MALNEIHCCLPEAVEARLCGIGDRRAFASRAIREGEVMLQNQPLAYALLGDHRLDRCAYCLSTAVATNGVDPNPKLLRCSRCQQARYCSRDCQKLDFPYHKIECQESNLLYGTDDKTIFAPDLLDHDNNDARLLVRTFLACQKHPEQCFVSKDNSSFSSTCCGSEHFQNLAMTDNDEHHGIIVDNHGRDQANRASKAIWNQRRALQKMSTTSNAKPIPNRLSDLQDQMEQDLKRFRCNNFGITDSLVRVCASGVYPLGALLNHSCTPNCLLRYVFGKHRSPYMQVVAARDIQQGEELTHSYTELVVPTNSRRAKLKSLYGFNCQCPRCDPTGNDTRCFFQLPATYKTMKSTDLVRWILQHYNPFVQGTDRVERMTSLQMEQIVKPLSDSHAVKVAQHNLETAQLCLVNGSIQNELKALQEAVKVLEKASELDEPSSLGAISSPELYKARGDRLGSLIVAGQWAEAVNECEYIVAFLCLALHNVTNHALLGLQLFTLGDLYESNGCLSEAKLVFQWASKVLHVSHGPDNDMTKMLIEKGN
ncbi:SET methyltransferase domain containing protein [Nitzschia inconspicua]|uniref:SET methyltransferase domain containing protein n=1 Tax=Nitzschia inconspicua TaxID=303405 RepID=A0A9K3L8U6_9STRA|nr:SET methyltransferase domain containing protein [Nitzschia inconspicua]